MQQVQKPSKLDRQLWVNSGSNSLSSGNVWSSEHLGGKKKNNMRGCNVDRQNGDRREDKEIERIRRGWEWERNNVNIRGKWEQRVKEALCLLQPSGFLPEAAHNQAGNQKLDRRARGSEGCWGFHNATWLKTLTDNSRAQTSLKCGIKFKLKDMKTCTWISHATHTSTNNSRNSTSRNNNCKQRRSGKHVEFKCDDSVQLKARVCVHVGSSCALIFHDSKFSGEKSALLTQQHNRGLACGSLPSMHFCLLFTLCKKQSLSIQTLWPQV